MAILRINGVVQDYEPVGFSQFGAVLDNIVFEAGKYTDLDGNQHIYDKLIANDATVRVTSAEKEVILSQVAGQNGTNKEYVAANDLKIEITIRLTSAQYSAASLGATALGRLSQELQAVNSVTQASQAVPPTQDMIKLVNLWRVPGPLQVRSKHLQNVWGVNSLIILDMPEERISPDTYIYKLSCLSDNGLDLESFTGADEVDTDTALSALLAAI